MNLFLTIDVDSTAISQWALGSGNLYSEMLILSLIVLMITLLVAAIMVQKAMRGILQLTMPEQLKQEEAEKNLARITKKQARKARWSKIMGLRPIDEEQDIMIDHAYDGITELDNPIPIWFNALFYSTVTFGIGYLLIYHVFGWGLNQDQEYQYEIQRAEMAKQAYLAQAANLVDENSVVYNADQIPAGNILFQANCAACHGAVGEGGIGPNLSDMYWLHGGEMKDVFKTVKYGVPDKGMVPWEQTLTPAQIAEVSSYILSLRGTQPANAKAPQGVEVIYNTAQESDDADVTTAN